MTKPLGGGGGGGWYGGGSASSKGGGGGSGYIHSLESGANTYKGFSGSDGGRSANPYDDSIGAGNEGHGEVRIRYDACAMENYGCEEGYHVEGTNCIPNECSCHHGVGATGKECYMDGIRACQDCNDGYYLKNSTFCDLDAGSLCNTCEELGWDIEHNAIGSRMGQASLDYLQGRFCSKRTIIGTYADAVSHCSARGTVVCSKELIYDHGITNAQGKSWDFRDVWTST